MPRFASRINSTSNVRQLIKEFSPVVGYDLARSIINSMSPQLREHVYFNYYYVLLTLLTL
jgi:hypothetical protein